MPEHPQIIPAATDALRDQIAGLVALCRAHEGLALTLGLDAPDDRRTLLAYVEGERLIGAAAIVNWGGGPEVALAVYPDRRRQGIGRALLGAALRTLREAGASEGLLVAHHQVATGPAFAQSVGGALRFSEHRLVLDPARVNQSRPRHAALQMRPASAADIDVLARISAAAFADPEDDARTRVAAGLQMPDRQYFLGELAGEPVGSLRVGRYGSSVADVTAFGVLPARQGRGYGRQMLGDAVDLLLAERWPEIAIEVETENANALGLYQSVGFVVQSTFDYYAIAELSAQA